MRKIKCFVHFDTPDSNEKRAYALSAYTKSDYIFSCFERLGLSTHILSASRTLGEKRVGRVVKQIGPCTTLELLPSLGRGHKIKNAFSIILFRIQLLIRLLSFVKKNDVLWVYHSLSLIPFVRLLKKIKKFKLLLEVEELYGDVLESDKVVKRELNFAKLADGYIFPSKELEKKVNSKQKPYAISHGTYKTPSLSKQKHVDEKIHVVYSGTLDPRKGGAAAAAAARFLPAEYHIHILGCGNKSEVAAIKDLIADISKSADCRITYDGYLVGDAYLHFLQSCHIGLSTQNPDAAFNATSFPSKILSYMSNGLQVVSIRIPAIENSNVGAHIHYYEEQTPEAIAKAILSVDLTTPYDSQAIISDLDKRFIDDLKNMLSNF